MFEDKHFKDHAKELRIFKIRLVVMTALMLIFFAALISRYYNLQVLNYQTYITQSEHNRVHVEPIAPTRGIISDRSGRVIAENHASFTLSLVLNKEMDLEATLALLKTIVDISPLDLDKFYKLKKQQIHPLEPIPLRYRLTEEEIARIAVNEYRLDGVQVDAELVRYYPYGELFAHSVGFVSRISENDLTKFSEEQILRYSGTHSIGKTGIEASYEHVLMGEVGSQNVETNARGRIQRVLDRVDPKQGKNIKLYLDVKLQQQAADAMAGRRGALVAIDVKTGGILAAVSNPSFDSNLFVTGISFNDFKNLNESSEMPLINRFIQGQYPSGSTIKPMVGLIGLELGFTDPNRIYQDRGYFMLPGNTYQWRDWVLAKTGGGHGAVNLKKAIAESCDTYFWDLASRIGIDGLHDLGTRFGLGARTGIDIPNERAGVWPSRDWKREKKKMAWYPGDTVNMGIGQGFVLVTPLQLAVMTSTIANRGDRYRPQFVKSIDGVEVAPVREAHIDIKKEFWDAVFDGMQEVIYGARGTARAYNAGQGADYRMAAKTGTVSLVSIAQGTKYDASTLRAEHRDHVLFISFAPADDPKIALAVVLENDDHKSEHPSLLARKVFDAYLHGIYREPGQSIDGVETNKQNKTAEPDYESDIPFDTAPEENLAAPEKPTNE